MDTTPAAASKRKNKDGSNQKRKSHPSDRAHVRAEYSSGGERKRMKLDEQKGEGKKRPSVITTNGVLQLISKCIPHVPSDDSKQESLPECFMRSARQSLLEEKSAQTETAALVGRLSAPVTSHQHTIGGMLKLKHVVVGLESISPNVVANGNITNFKVLSGSSNAPYLPTNAQTGAALNPVDVDEAVLDDVDCDDNNSGRTCPLSSIRMFVCDVVLNRCLVTHGEHQRRTKKVFDGGGSTVAMVHTTVKDHLGDEHDDKFLAVVVILPDAGVFYCNRHKPKSPNGCKQTPHPFAPLGLSWLRLRRSDGKPAKGGYVKTLLQIHQLQFSLSSPFEDSGLNVERLFGYHLHDEDASVPLIPPDHYNLGEEFSLLRVRNLQGRERTRAEDAVALYDHLWNHCQNPRGLHGRSVSLSTAAFHRVLKTKGFRARGYSVNDYLRSEYHSRRDESKSTTGRLRSRHYVKGALHTHMKPPPEVEGDGDGGNGPLIIDLSDDAMWRKIGVGGVDIELVVHEAPRTPKSSPHASEVTTIQIRRCNDQKLLRGLATAARNMQKQKEVSPVRSNSGDLGSMYSLGVKSLAFDTPASKTNLKNSPIPKKALASTVTPGSFTKYRMLEVVEKMSDIVVRDIFSRLHRFFAWTFPATARVSRDIERDYGCSPCSSMNATDHGPCTCDVSVNLKNATHYDIGDASKSCSVWVRGAFPSKGKQNSAKSSSQETPVEGDAVDDRFFVLPNALVRFRGTTYNGVAIRLFHGVSISWDGRVVRHGTSEGPHAASTCDRYFLSGWMVASKQHVVDASRRGVEGFKEDDDNEDKKDDHDEDDDRKPPARRDL